MDEVATAARAFGFSVPESFIQSQIDMTPPMGACAPSNLLDRPAGRTPEIEAIRGEPLRRAQAAGLAMLRLKQLHARLCKLVAAPS